MSKTEALHDLSALADAYQDEPGTRRGQRRLAEGLRRLREDPRERQRIDDIADLVEAGRDAYQLGKLAEQQGNLDEAERHYCRAAEIGHDDAVRDLARVLLAMNKHAKAEHWRQRAQALGLLPPEKDPVGNPSDGTVADEPGDAHDDSPPAATTTIRCEEALALVYMCLDRELATADLELIKQHLDQCDDCLGEYGLQQAVKRLVARHCGCDPVSPGLRSKVLQRIHAVRASIAPEPSEASAEEQRMLDRIQGWARALQAELPQPRKDEAPGTPADHATRASRREQTTGSPPGHHPVAPTGTLKRGTQVTGTDRAKLAADLKNRYNAGESIRSLATATGRSYGFIYRVLTEAGVSLRGRAGAKQARETRR